VGEENDADDDDDDAVFYQQVAASFAVLTIAVSTWIGNVMDMTIVMTTVTNRTAVSSTYTPCHINKTCQVIFAMCWSNINRFH